MRKRTLKSVAESLGMLRAGDKTKAEINHFITVALAILRTERTAPRVDGSKPGIKKIKRGDLLFTVGFDESGAAEWLRAEPGFKTKTAIDN